VAPEEFAPSAEVVLLLPPLIRISARSGRGRERM